MSDFRESFTNKIPAPLRTFGSDKYTLDNCRITISRKEFVEGLILLSMEICDDKGLSGVMVANSIQSTLFIAKQFLKTLEKESLVVRRDNEYFLTDPGRNFVSNLKQTPQYEDLVVILNNISQRTKELAVNFENLKKAIEEQDS